MKLSLVLNSIKIENIIGDTIKIVYHKGITQLDLFAYLAVWSIKTSISKIEAKTCPVTGIELVQL